MTRRTRPSRAWPPRWPSSPRGVLRPRSRPRPPPADSPPSPRRTLVATSRGKRVAVLVEKLYEDLELWYPVLRLREAGCDVKIVGPKAGETYASKHGYPAKADVSAADVSADDFDAIVIPGGYSPDHMRRCR